jgi:hypothetical protein
MAWRICWRNKESGFVTRLPEIYQDKAECEYSCKMFNLAYYQLSHWPEEVTEVSTSKLIMSSPKLEKLDGLWFGVYHDAKDKDWPYTIAFNKPIDVLIKCLLDPFKVHTSNVKAKTLQQVGEIIKQVEHLLE